MREYNDAFPFKEKSPKLEDVLCHVDIKKQTKNQKNDNNFITGQLTLRR